MAEYRKSQEVSLAEESASRTLTPAELASLPADLETRLTSVRQRVIPLVESWTRITSTADKIAHRRQNQGREYAGLRDALEHAVEISQGAWRPSQVGQVERHIRSVASLAGDVADTNELSAQRSFDSVVESLKQVGTRRASDLTPTCPRLMSRLSMFPQHREIFVNLRDLFGRQVALGGDQVDKLRKRLDGNTSKVSTPRPSLRNYSPTHM